MTLDMAICLCYAVSDNNLVGWSIQGSIDNINLFQIIQVMAFIMLTPISLFIEGGPFLPHKLAAAVRANPKPCRQCPGEPTGCCRLEALLHQCS